jgi:hypothetical protein
MHKKIHFANYYQIMPLFVGAALVGVEYLGRLNATQSYQDIAITVALFVVMYLSLRFDHCLISNREFSRTSFFFWKHTIPISEISEITFPPTWIISPEARTLVVWRKDGDKITMTDMAYTRPVLADAVKTLLRANPRTRLDDNTHALLQIAKLPLPHPLK